MYLALNQVVTANNLTFQTDGIVSPEIYDLEKELTTRLNKDIKSWAKKELNSKDCRFVFKREYIADVGIFLQKKRYILHALDEEGIPCNKMKYTGVEIVRTTTPATLKPLLKNIIEVMFATQDYQETNKILNEVYTKFRELPIESIAKVSSLNNYEKYARDCKDFKPAKKMPAHCKAAYFYNRLLKIHKLDKNYEQLASGDKVRFFAVQKPNTYGIEVIGFKNTWPKEFNQFFKLDYDTAYDKMVFSPIEKIYEAVNWKAYKPNLSVQTDLFDLFS